MNEPEEFKREARVSLTTGKRVIVVPDFNGDPYSYFTAPFGDKIDFQSRNGTSVTVLTPEIPLFVLEESGQVVGDGLYDRSSALGADERFLVDTRPFLNGKPVESPSDSFTVQGLEALIGAFQERTIELKTNSKRKEELRQFYAFAVNVPSQKSLTGILLPSREIPPVVQSEVEKAAGHYDFHFGRCMYCDIKNDEIRRANDRETRFVTSNGSYVSFLPFAQSDPLEVHVLPLKHTARMTDLTEEQIRDLAMIIYESVARIKSVARATRRNYDAVNIAFHSAPVKLKIDPNTQNGKHSPEDYYHFHVEISPGQIPLDGSPYHVPFSGWDVITGRPKDTAYKLRHAFDPVPKLVKSDNHVDPNRIESPRLSFKWDVW